MYALNVMQRRSVLSQFASIEAVGEAFPDEQAAIDFVAMVRWGVWPTCPFCESRRKFCRFRDGKLQKCLDCGRRFSVQVGTHLAYTKMPLRAWLMAIWYAENTERPNSSHLARMLSVTQKTAWYVLKSLREHGPTLEAMLKPTWRRKGMTDDDDPKLPSLEERMALARERYGLTAPKHVRTQQEREEEERRVREEQLRHLREMRNRMTDEERAAVAAFLEKNAPTRAGASNARDTQRDPAVDAAIAYLFAQNGEGTMLEAAKHAGCNYRTLVARLHYMRQSGKATPSYRRPSRHGEVKTKRHRDPPEKLKEAAGWCLEAGFSTTEAAEREGVAVHTLQRYMERLEAEGVDVSTWREAQARSRINASSKGAMKRHYNKD